MGEALSADTERHGHITKEGNRVVRSLVIQAALVHTRPGKGPSRKHYLGVLRRRGKQIARVAAANKILGANGTPVASAICCLDSRS